MRRRLGAPGKRAASRGDGSTRIGANPFVQRRTRMQYFVTGATGFIGKRLVKSLLARRGAVVHFLLRPESEAKVAELLAYWGVTKARAIPVFGDLTGKKLGVASD